MNLPPSPPQPPPTSPEQHHKQKQHPTQKQHQQQNHNTRTMAGTAGCLSHEKFDVVVSGTVQQPTAETAVSTTIEATKEQKDQINFGLFAPTRVLKFLLGELKSKLNGLLPTPGKRQHTVERLKDYNMR